MLSPGEGTLRGMQGRTGEQSEPPGTVAASSAASGAGGARWFVQETVIGMLE